MNLNYINEQFEIFNNPEFKFDEEKHVYTLNNEKLISTTQLISKYFKPKFDTENISKYVAKKRGISQKEILDEWAAIAKYGCDLGTACHRYAEYRVLNKIDNEFDFSWMNDINYLNRIHEFNKFYLSIKNKIHFLRPELQMFHNQWKIAGTMDLPFILKLKNILCVGDHKFNKKIKDENHKYGKSEKLLYPFDDIWSNDITIYSIQLSIYGLIIEEMTNLKIGGFYIFHFGLDSPGKIIKCFDFRERLKNWFINNYI